jgi:ferredoxin
MNVAIDNNKCIGCGLCPSVCPEVFGTARGGKACVIEETVPPDAVDYCIQAMELCPMEAIMVASPAMA